MPGKNKPMRSVLKFHYFVDDKVVIQPGTKCSPKITQLIAKKGLDPKSRFLNFASLHVNITLLSHHSTLVHEFVGHDSTFN